MHCLLVYIDFNKISAIILIFIPLHVIYFFPLAAFKVFSLSLILNNFIIICLGKDFFMFFEVGINWTYWICEFIKFEKVFTTISLYFLFFLISPLGMLIKYISGCLNCSQFTNTFFFNSLFLCFILDSFYCYDFKITNLFLRMFNMFQYTVNDIQ